VEASLNALGVIRWSESHLDRSISHLLGVGIV
jgi:hypothetical protein